MGYFWNGALVSVDEVIHKTSLYADNKPIATAAGDTLITVLMDYTDRNREGCEFLVDGRNIKPFVCDVFKVHDEVRATSGTFSGVITGFEHKTNSAVVMSHKIARYGNDKTRYAYPVDKLVKYDPDGIILVKGKHYIINNNTSAFAVETANTVRFADTRGNTLMFVGNDGDILYTNVPMVTTYKKLKQTYNIDSIRLR